MPRTFSRFSVIAFLSGLCLGGAPHAYPPRIDEKGRDIDQMAREDSLQRAAAVSREKERLEKRRAYVRSLLLDEPAHDCVALLSRDRRCLLSVHDFNRAAANWLPDLDSLEAIPDRSEVDQIRRNLLYALLEDPYLQDMASRSGEKDSLEAEFERARSGRILALRKSSGDSALRKLYRSHHARLFRGRTETAYQVIGAGDSAYADSLRRLALAAGRGGAASGRDSLPWRPVPEASLPSRIRAALASSGPGETPAPFRTPYGFLLVRVQDRRVIPEMPFEEAVPLLISLGNTPAETDPRKKALIASYYERHRELFTAPDSLRLKTWLMPGCKRKRGSFAKDMEARIRRNQPVEDTLKWVPIVVEDSVLPGEVRAAIMGHPSLRQGAFLGPVQSAFGDWYFRILEIRPGKRLLTLEEAGAEIAASLFPGQDAEPSEIARGYADSKEAAIRKNLLSEHLQEAFRPPPDRLAALEKSPAADSLAAKFPGMPETERNGIVRGLLIQAEADRRLDEDRAAWMRRDLKLQFIQY